MTSLPFIPQKISFEIHKTKRSRINEIDFNNLPFGRFFSDHMFEMDYQNGQWKRGVVKAYGKLELSPATAALHYGQAIFEGIKANRNQNTGEILVFRPYDNARRFNLSAHRMDMPEIDEEIFVEAIKELIKLDHQWVPTTENSSLYIRPVMFSTDDCVGVRTSENYKFLIMTSPVGPYYSKPIKVVVADKYVRAADGGTGEAKAAGNYGGAMYPTSLAKKRGYDQVLWTDSREHRYLEEIGTMNVFFVIGDEVVTPSLDGTILRGITRDSIIHLLSEKGVTVTERRISIDDLIDAQQKGILFDAFGAGTAATITPIEEIAYKDTLLTIPLGENRKHSIWVKSELEAIKRGIKPDVHNWLVKI
ncbi:MAG TPA: branched-chain amino acid aminotransferase [Chitinophagales bacterium]|nr:branched-chain amino acid aminotransferase [Chitinophagales bacterium]